MFSRLWIRLSRAHTTNGIGALLKHLSSPLQSTSSYMHTKIEDNCHCHLRVKVMPALKDNLMYLLVDTLTGVAVAIDPVDPELILSAIRNEQLKLECALLTHHHWDHSGGNEKLQAMWHKPLPIYGGDDRIVGLTNKIADNEVLKISNMEIKCIYTPCHTKGHYAYLVKSLKGVHVLFSGDTLFQAGTGPFLEGTPEDMCNSLTKLKKLPDDTVVYCGHELTLTNLMFAQSVEPENEAIPQRIAWAAYQRAFKSPTVPSTIKQEKAWNPFMRIDCSPVKQFASEEEPAKVMEKLRQGRDKFIAWTNPNL